MGTGSRRARASSHSSADDMKFWQHSGDCTTESSDRVLHLAGVNKHADLRVVVGDQWRAPAGVDEPNIAANGGKVEMSAFAA